MPSPPEPPPEPPFPWRRVLCFLALAILLLRGLGWVFDFTARQDLRSKWHWVLAQQGGDYDFAVLGPSTAYVGVDVFLLENELGGRGINLALDGSGYPEELLALRKFVGRNRVRHLILVVNLAGFDGSSLDYPFHDYEFLPFRGDPMIDEAVRQECGWKALAWKYVPFWQNAEFNSKIGPLQFYGWCKAKFDPAARLAEFDTKGSRLVTRPFHQRKELRPARLKIEPHLTEALSEIIHFSEEQGIRVTLTLPPELTRRTGLQLNREELLKTYAQIAEAHGARFLVFDDLPLVEDPAYFLDTAHLNERGARTFTRALASRLKASVFP